MFRSTGNFDRLLDRATSQLLLEPDWDSILNICDEVRGGDISGRYAVGAIKKKLVNKNPHVQLFALQVLESCVKNCSSPIHDEVGTKVFMEEFREITKTSDEIVKNKILELIQTWSHAFRNQPTYRAVQDTYNLLKVEGQTFPVLKESDAMFAAEKAPEWADGEVCHRCRVEFSIVQRQHHCRHCGQVFCNKCSSKQATIPKFGIEKEVRVCDTCHEQLQKTAATEKKPEGELPAEYLASPLSKQNQNPPSKSEAELQEQDDIQLAMALSMDEAENKEKPRSYDARPRQDDPRPGGNNYQGAEMTSSLNTNESSDLDPELARYLNRSYWEQKQEKASTITKTLAQPSAPVSEPMVVINPVSMGVEPIKLQEQYQNGETGDDEHLLQTIQSHLEIFINRMHSNQMRGRSVGNDTSVQSLFQSLTALHPQLMKMLQDQEDSRAHYEGLQDKLSQLRDAREALDALRDEHMEKIRREAEEAERIRQIQLAHKLEIMRQKKQEYLEYQRQVTLQRLQERERERLLRIEQQKQQYQQMSAGYSSLPPYQQYPQQSAGPTGYPLPPDGQYHQSYPGTYQPQAEGQGPSPYTAQGYGAPGVPSGYQPPPVGMGYQQQPGHMYNPHLQQPQPNQTSEPQSYPNSNQTQAPPGAMEYQGSNNAPQHGGAYSMQPMAASLPPVPGVPIYSQHDGGQPQTPATGGDPYVTNPPPDNQQQQQQQLISFD